MRFCFLKASPAEISWRAGVDILSFGATKNGRAGAEAVVIFDKKLAADFAFSPQTGWPTCGPRCRFLAAQFDAYS